MVALTSPEAACPACQHKEGSVLQTYRAAEAAQHHVRRETDAGRHDALRDHIRRLWSADECRVVKCLRCGFVHAQPYVAGDAAFYALAFGRTAYPAWRWEFEVTRDTIASLKRNNELGEFHMLEIGAGDGAFLRRMIPELIPSERAVATEYSAYGSGEIEKLGVTCLPVDVRDLAGSEYEGRFRVVCLFQVLEHMDRLDQLFERLGALTAPGAHMFVAVPNEIKIAFNEQHGSLLDLPPNHIGRWTQRSFTALAERHGWRVAEHRREIEGIRTKTVRHLKFVRARRAQVPGSLANRLERISSGRLRRPAIAVGIALTAWRTLPALWNLARRSDLGDSQWVWLRKR